MIEQVIIYFLFPLSIVACGILTWYIRRILSIMEDRSLELNERFSVFHTFLEETYNMDLFYGEPRLKQLLELIKDFHEWSEEFQNRIIVDKDDSTDTDPDED